MVMVDKPQPRFKTKLIQNLFKLAAFDIPTHGRTCLDLIMLKTEHKAFKFCYIVQYLITDQDSTILFLKLEKSPLNSIEQ